MDKKIRDERKEILALYGIALAWVDGAFLLSLLIGCGIMLMKHLFNNVQESRVIRG